MNTQISRKEDNTPIYHIGLRREGRKLIIQAKESIDDLSCEITDYLGPRQVSKATIEANKTILLEGLKALPKYRLCDMVEVEEPEERYERPKMDKFKQIAYLERMQKKLTIVYHAIYDLSRAWSDDTSHDLDMNEFLADKYPFNQSCDDLTLEVDLWYKNGWTALNKKIKVLQGYPVEKVYGTKTEDAPEPRFEESEEEYEHLKKEVEYLTNDREALQFEVKRLRGIIRSARYYVVSVWGDVEPSLSREFNNEKARDEEAKRMKKEDLEENGEAYSGIYWLNIIRNEVVIGSYSGIFFEDEAGVEEPPARYIVIEKQDPEWPVIITDETGQPKVYETLVCAKIESDMCQNGQVVAILEEPPAPYYTPEEAEGKWVCAFDTICEGWQCVRYSEGDKEDYPVLYDSKEAVETDDFFDPDDDFAIPATEFIEERRAMWGKGGLHITGTPIVKGYKIMGNMTTKAEEPEMQWNKVVKLAKQWQSDDYFPTDIDTIVLELDNNTRIRLLEAQEKCNLYGYNYIALRAWSNAGYYNSEGVESDFRTDVEDFKVFKDAIYFYAQSKYDSGCQIESEMFTIKPNLCIEMPDHAEIENYKNA